jgi:hypothetical protein
MGLHPAVSVTRAQDVLILLSACLGNECLEEVTLLLPRAVTLALVLPVE